MSSYLDLAGGVTEEKLVQLLSSDQPWCRDWSENSAWGRDWYTVHLPAFGFQIPGEVVGLLGVDLVGDGDGKLLGGGSPQPVHVVVWSGDQTTSLLA